MDLAVCHCNARTDFALIEHEFDPGGCAECARLVQIGGTLDQTRAAIDRAEPF